MIGDLLRHSLDVVTHVSGATLDSEGADLGHPAGTEAVASFRGLVQPRSARERASSAGRDVNIGAYRIFLEAAALGVVTPDSTIRKSGAPDPDMNGTYRVLFVGNAAGQGHHVEIDADRQT